MARSVDRDFNELLKFIESYSLSSVVDASRKVTKVRSAHKIYLTALHLWSRCNSLFEDSALEFHGIKFSEDKRVANHLRESIADIGSGLLCAVHGLYKQAQMSLRSSIENFIRFSGGPFSDEIWTTGRLSDAFESCKTTPMYVGDCAAHLSKLKVSYGDLCKYAHSATLEHMTGKHALQTFPDFDDQAFEAWIAFARTIVKAYLAIVFLNAPSIYLRSHYKSQEVFDLLLSGPQRAKLRQPRS